MKSQRKASIAEQHRVASAAMRAVMMVGISLVFPLSGCTPQPESMFEQQAEASANPTITTQTSAAPSATTVPTSTDNASHSTTATVRATPQQAIARQPNCDPSAKPCQYLELNVLSFSPKQPWLDDIMWQTIARTLAPETPLASQSQSAKNTVSMLFNQIAYSERPVTSLPMYQRIDTQLHLNPAVNDNARVSTAYLTIHSSQQQDASTQSHRYVMLDMQKKLQLTLDDILLPHVSDSDVLKVFQPAKKAWLRAQGVEKQYLNEWPLALSDQWYLDEQGLHMVYQTGELLSAKTEAADLVVSYDGLQGVIKPQYQVAS